MYALWQNVQCTSFHNSLCFETLKLRREPREGLSLVWINRTNHIHFSLRSSIRTSVTWTSHFSLSSYIFLQISFSDLKIDLNLVLQLKNRVNFNFESRKSGYICILNSNTALNLILKHESWVNYNIPYIKALRFKFKNWNTFCFKTQKLK